MYSASACRAPVAELVVQRRQHLLADREQFVVGIVGEVDVMRDARAEAGIGLEELVHPVGVAGENHDEVVALVLHHLQQDLDRLLPVVALVLLADRGNRPRR